MDRHYDTNFNQNNAHERDGRLSFEPIEHIYTIDAGTDHAIICESVTTVVGSCFQEFDSAYWAARKATPERTAEMIMAEWEAKAKESRDLGTLMHARIEAYFNGSDGDAMARCDKAYNQFLRFQSALKLTPYRTEWPVFYEECGLAGTIDFLAYDSERDVYEIYDWKRSLKVANADGTPNTSNFGKFAIGNLASLRLRDTSYDHYALQLSLYRRILADKYGINVAACHLGVFHPQLGSYMHMANLPYYEEAVDILLKNRRR